MARGAPMILQRMDTAPKNGMPILVLCIHEADSYTTENGKQTPYAYFCENLQHPQNGFHVVEWEAGDSVVVNDDEYEIDTYGEPGWWFLTGDNDYVANPVAWCPLPDAKHFLENFDLEIYLDQLPKD